MYFPFSLNILVIPYTDQENLILGTAVVQDLVLLLQRIALIPSGTWASVFYWSS